MYYIGVHSDEFALLRKEKSKIRLVQFFSSAGDVKPLDILKGKEGRVVTGLGADEVLIRTLFLKLKRGVNAALPFQIDQLIPYSEEERIVLPTLYPEKGGNKVLLLATSKDKVQRHLRENGADPDFVSCASVALFRFAAHFHKEVPSLIVWHRKGEEHTFVTIENRVLTSSHTVKGSDLTRITAYLAKKFPHIDTLLSVGDKRELGPFSHYNHLDSEDESLSECALSIGLALDALKNDKQTTQFRVGAFTKPTAIRSVRKWQKRFIAATVVAICSTFLFGTLHLKNREKAILAALNAPEGQNLKQVVSGYEKQLMQKKQTKLNLSTLPKVSEVLSYLGSHPLLQEGCSLTHFHYKILQSPKLGSTARTWSGKIELELLAEDPAKARAFHQALLKDRQFVDQKKDVKWSAEYGLYRTSFYLKQRPRT